MDIFISNVDKVPAMIHHHGITHVLTLLRGRELNELILPKSFDRNNWLYMDMDDVINEDADFAPTQGQVAEFMDWGKSIPDNGRLLVHCYAGVSRSTAAALAIKVAREGLDRIPACIDWLVSHRPIACPNPIITKHADLILRANGELHAEAEKVANAKLLKLYGGSLDIVRNVRNNLKS